MALILSKINKSLIKCNYNQINYSKVYFTTLSGNQTKGHKLLLTATGLLGASAVGLYYTVNESVKASDLELHAPSYPWSHNGVLKGFDHAGIRRGYEVYKQVCAACHSIKYLHYRQLVGVSHTTEEAKEEAAQIQVLDDPDDEGKVKLREGKLFDKFPSPYPNEEAARAANGGGLPPDLTLIVSGRHGNEDYIFSLLTGYCEAPAGIKVDDGKHFNPFFPGGVISMSKVLYDGAMQYSDQTPATSSQMAKDVTTFLSWAAQPELDTRKKMLTDALLILIPLLLFTWYWKRSVWMTMKSRKIIFTGKRSKN